MEAKPIEKDVALFEERHPVVVNSGVPASSNPADLLAIAVSQNADIDKLEKLMALQEKWEANEARKAYTRAMSAFKLDPPEIWKDAHVSFPAGGKTTEYDHATLGNLTSTIGKALSKHGLSAAWKTEQNGQIIVTCTITHEQGHSESTSLTAAADVSGSKNAIQAIGSTITYLQRYTLMALTGLAAKGQDDDGGGMDPIEYITEEQLSKIIEMADESGANAAQFLKYLGVEALEKLPAKDYNKAVAALEVKLKAKQKADRGTE